MSSIDTPFCGSTRCAAMISEVDGEREHERREHEQVERALLPSAERVRGRVEGEAAGEREPGVGDQVVQEEVRLVAPAEPAHGDRRDPDHGGGRSSQEHHREHEREEAARDLDARRGVRGRDVAHDREHEQRGEKRHVPVGVADHADATAATSAESSRAITNRLGLADRVKPPGNRVQRVSAPASRRLRNNWKQLAAGRSRTEVCESARNNWKQLAAGRYWTEVCESARNDWKQLAALPLQGLRFLNLLATTGSSSQLAP